MSAPQLPDVALYGDWFCPDTIARCDSRASSQYSQRTATPSLGSAKSSVSFKPSREDDIQHQPALLMVEDFLRAIADESPTTQSMASIPTATPDNGFLGFCKGAWTLQNGDQKGSMKKYSEADAWSRSAARAKLGPAQYLKVCQCPSKCSYDYCSTS